MKKVWSCCLTDIVLDNTCFAVRQFSHWVLNSEPAGHFAQSIKICSSFIDSFKDGVDYIFFVRLGWLA